MTSKLSIYNLAILLAFTGAGCATSSNVATTDVTSSDSMRCDRGPASQGTLSCEQLLGPGVLSSFQENPGVQVEAAVSKTQMRYPVSLSKEMAEFRAEYLPYLKTSARHALISSFEARLRMRSEMLKSQLLASADPKKYDMIIVGTGVHGLISLQEALAQNPNMRILILDEGDTAGATFRYANGTFNINSSNRASDQNKRPLPGEGNINELPGLPVQVSDLTAVKYPNSNDMGETLVAGLFAAVQKHPANVDVLFNVQAKPFQTHPDATHSEMLKANFLTGEPLTLLAQAIVVSTGVGRPDIPEAIRKTIADTPALTATSAAQPIPKVVTFEDLMRILGRANDPMALLRNLKIGVVGNGDSANVLIEFMLGYASADAYGSSSAQSGLAKEIVWIGQTKRTCDQFRNSIRSRYSQIGTGFRSSAQGGRAILRAVPGRLREINLKNNQVAALTNSGEVEDVDLIVLATGAEQTSRNLLTDVTEGKSGQFAKDTDFLSSDMMTTMTSPTRTSEGNATNVGRQLKGRNIYFIGTAAGPLAEQSELKGIIQNKVSIFNNAPRVIAATDEIMRKMKPDSPSATPPMKMRFEKIPEQFAVAISGTSEVRTLGANTLDYLEQTLAGAVHLTDDYDSVLSFELSLAPDSTLVFSANDGVDFSPLVRLLSSTREFFDQSRLMLMNLPGRKLTFSIYPPGLTNRRVFVGIGMQTEIPKPTRTFKNGQIMLRGLQGDYKGAPEPLSRTAAPSGRPRQSSGPLTRSPNIGADYDYDSDYDRYIDFRPPRQSALAKEQAELLQTSLARKELGSSLYTVPAGKYETNDRLIFSIKTEVKTTFQFSSRAVNDSTWRLIVNEARLKLASNPRFERLLTIPLTLERRTAGFNTVAFSDPSNTRSPVVDVEILDLNLWFDALNELSKAGQSRDLLRTLFPGHENGDTYRLITESEWKVARKKLRDLGENFGFRDTNEIIAGDTSVTRKFANSQNADLTRPNSIAIRKLTSNNVAAAFRVVRERRKDTP